MDYTFKKSTSERYDIRFSTYGWAIITIDENGGIFNVQSDYGDYSYRWPGHGRKSFKHFLVEITRDSHYLLKNISSPTEFDFDTSLKQWEKAIIETRRAGDCTKEEARAVWKVIENIDPSSSPDLVHKELYESEEIWKIWPEPWYTFETIMNYPAGARYFVNEVMPMFAEILSKEIKEKAS